MSEKTLKTRIVHKHDVESNWIKATGFIPKQGELIVYDIDDTHTYERFKIGDGKTVVSSLPFADTTYAEATSAIAGLMSAADKAKLDGVDANANKYTHPTSHPASMITGLATVATSGSYNDLTDKPTVPVTSVAGKTGAVTLNNTDVGLGNVENKSSATIRGELTLANVTTALGYTPLPNTVDYINTDVNQEASSLDIFDRGVSWESEFMVEADGGTECEGTMVHYIPFVTGNNITFTQKDSGNGDVVEISASVPDAYTKSESDGKYVLTTDSRLSDARTPTAHNQASSTINAMTGYTKPLTTSAIAKSDTLNAAIGKLEAGLGLKANQLDLATVASTGSYDDLTDVPKTFAPRLHNQTSDTIIEMTGYVKPASTSAIAEADSLNTAIGKLEKALDGKQASGSYSTTGHKHAASDITSGTLDIARLPSITSDKITSLDASKLTGTVPTSALPSYVDDVLEYTAKSSFPATGETGKIYVDTTTNKTYRWGGSAYVEISESLALGTTASTAYYGDKGKIAYDHSQAAHAPSNAEANVQSDWNVTDTTSDAYIKNKPTIPTVNNGTLTIQKNSTTIDTFSANSASNKTINITVPTGAAADKGVDTSISAASTSTNLPTSKAVAAFVEGKGYKTTDNNDNQKVKTGSVTFGVNDIVEFVAGDNVTITGNATNKTIEISATDTNTHAVTSVAGKTGAITLTKSDVGLGSVVNTGDSATPVSGGTTKFTTGGAYTELNKKVDKTTTVNGHALSDNVTVTKSDVGLGNVENKSSATIRDEITSANVTDALGYTPLDADEAYAHPTSHPATMITGLADVATSGSYNDLSDKPTIPTVNNATLTIQKNGTTVETFTANSSTNVTANITVPTALSGLTDDSTHRTVTDTEKATWNAKGTSNLTIGTTGTTAAAGNHIHTTTIASSTGTNELTLAHGSKYAITAGGDSFVFTMPTAQTSVSGNAGTATKLASAKTISLTGDVTGSVSFDGGDNVSMTTTISDDSHNHTIANVDGLQAALDGKQASGSYVTTTNTGVQNIAGGLVVGGTSATATGKGRIMVTGNTNPLIGLQAIDSSGNQLTPYYFQVSNDKMYLGPTSTKALAFDSSGNTTIPAALTVGGAITEKGTALSSKYALKTELPTFTYNSTTKTLTIS